MAFPAQRPRRLRQSPAIRRMVAQTRLHPSDLVLPVFVREGATEPVPIGSMPGVVQHTLESLVEVAQEAVAAGLGGLMVFGVPLDRDATGSGADDPDGILNVALRAVRDAVGDDLVLMADLCLDEFTDHGHCGCSTPRRSVDNDATLERYGAMALAQAAAGAHVVAPSGMMDGQVAHIRAVLDGAGHQDVVILAYAAKYASGFYGPFREAVESTLEGDRATYQQDPANATESLREVRLDIAEGADLVMVKPALPYLDILSAVAAESPVPVAAYQVSGEYAQIEAAAAQGWIDRDRVVMESLLSVRRAGAQVDPHLLRPRGGRAAALTAAADDASYRRQRVVPGRTHRGRAPTGDAASAQRSGSGLDQLDVQDDLDLLAHEDAAALDGDVPGQAEVLAVDLGGRLEAGAGAAPRVGRDAGEVQVEVHLAGDALDGEVAHELVGGHRGGGEGHHREAVGVEEVGRRQVRVAVGAAGVDRRSCTVACTEEVSKLSPTRTVASNSLNWPRTLLTMRCRATKPTSLCEGSTVQVPGKARKRWSWQFSLVTMGVVTGDPGVRVSVLVLHANSGMFKFQLMTGKLLL